MVTPQLMAEKLNMTTYYLNSSLHSTTGQTTLQLIHDLLIDTSKPF